jgi:hypothetical protein
MVKVSPQNLIREGLDWAVAKAIYGDRVVHEKTWRQTEDSHFKGSACDWCPDGKFALLTTNWQGTKASDILPYSTDREQGGRIIEEAGIDTWCSLLGRPDHADPAWRTSQWNARCVFKRPSTVYIGPTPLIAGVRSYVASKLGDEIEMPVVLYEAMLRSDPDLHDEQEPAEQPAPAANP